MYSLIYVITNSLASYLLYHCVVITIAGITITFIIRHMHTYILPASATLACCFDNTLSHVMLNL